MDDKPMIAIHNADTHILEVREMTDEEIASLITDQTTEPEPIEETPTEEPPASDDAGAPSIDAG